MPDYIAFLFNEDATLKQRYAPVVSYQKESDCFILKYSIPGHHAPRQYFVFRSIPKQFPNFYVSEIFRIFSITESFLFRRPKRAIPHFRSSIINEYFNIVSIPQPIDPDTRSIAEYNIELAISLGRKHHSLFYFDSYLENYKILHPEIRFTPSVVKSLQANFNKLISC